MKRVVLVEPASGGHISGGYLYNAEMARNGAWELCQTPTDDLSSTLDDVECDLLIADSIWLTEPFISPFLRRRSNGTRVAVMLHSFPSLIANAETEQRTNPRPNPFELDILRRLGVALLPGSHYAPELELARVSALVLDPGVDDRWRTPPKPRSEPCALVSVGSVTPRKGFLDVFDALEHVGQLPAFRWTIIGSLDAHPTYAARVRERASAFDGVVLAGQCSPEDTRAMVRGSDILVMPSYDENQPLVLLESLAASVPACGYQAGAAAHMLTQGKTGLLSPIGDKRGLGDHLARLLRSEAERYRMAEACWEQQRRLPNWATAARRARAVCQDLSHP